MYTSMLLTHGSQTGELVQMGGKSLRPEPITGSRKNWMGPAGTFSIWIFGKNQKAWELGQRQRSVNEKASGIGRGTERQAI